MTTISPTQISLTVAKANGNGNANNGAYNFTFTPDCVFIPKGGSQDIQVNLVKSDSTFIIFDWVSTAESQLSEKSKTISSVTVTDSDSKKKLIFLSVIVKDTTTNTLISCDPEVINQIDP